MFFLRKPRYESVRDVLHFQRKEPHTYAPVGMTKGDAPPGFNVDHNRIRLGHGPDVFERARKSIRSWEMFRIGWLDLCWHNVPTDEGEMAGVLVRIFGVWWLNCCRIVYTLDESTPEMDRYGFAYGTLPKHAESGEERFMVEWNHADDSVWFDLLAYSKPNGRLVQLGYPYARMLQRRFGRDAPRAFARSVTEEV